MKLTVDALARETQNLTEADFEKLHPHAALVFVIGRERPAPTSFDTMAGVLIKKGAPLPTLVQKDATPYAPVRNDLERAAREMLEETHDGDGPPPPRAEVFGAV